MMADRALVEAQELAQLMRVVRALPEGFEDASAVGPTAGARDEVPEQLPQGLAHVTRGRERRTD